MRMALYQLAGTPGNITVGRVPIVGMVGGCDSD
jgi:hypothetical protein